MLLEHPELPSCAACQEWIFNPEKGWQIDRKNERPVRRPPGTITPCFKCPKSIDKRTPNPAAELSAKNQRTLQLYYEVQAGRPMPDDRIVQRNCGLIKMVESQAGRNVQRDFVEMLQLVLLAPVKKGR